MNKGELETASSIMEKILKEGFTDWQLTRVNNMVLALLWSEETDKIATIFSNLIGEILRRDEYWGHTKAPPPVWRRMLPPPGPKVPKMPVVGSPAWVDWMLEDGDEQECLWHVLIRAGENRVRNFYGRIEPWGA